MSERVLPPGGGEMRHGDPPERPRRGLPERPPALRSRLAKLAALPRIFYTHNPFYLVSAALVLYGFDVAFGASDTWADSWTLLGVLSAYTGLMVLAALLIVRLGSVWEDARSVILVVVLLFGAVSVSFDEILVTNPRGGVGLLLVGLGCAIAMSEALLKGTGIRLGTLFKAPYYAIISIRGYALDSRRHDL